MMKRLVLPALIGFICVTASVAQPYPNRPLRFILPYPPGGGADVIGRMLAEKLAESLGQSVVVDNRPGAGGNIGMALVAKSPPDGYTLALGTLAPLGLAPSLYQQLPYDPLRDFAPISLVASAPTLLAVHPSLPVKSVSELIAFAKAHPGKLNYSSSGTGGGGHRAGEMFNAMAGVKMVHIPYKGGSPSVLALISNEVSLTFGTIPAVLPHVKSGKIRGIAVAGVKRSSVAPDLPTVAEAGLPGFYDEAWWGVIAPAKTPKTIIVRLNAELVKIAHNPNMREKLFRLGADAIGSSPEQFSDHIEAEIKRWAKLAKEIDIRAE
ncbi:MAG: tripartite tricarboxylate transporter substrate binding protein [Betaproteobacteria bacterium]|nr:tripartite tricarboxylate transporter substrate binding protein [Betaproteobacteria bacterium]